MGNPGRRSNRVAGVVHTGDKTSGRGKRHRLALSVHLKHRQGIALVETGAPAPDSGRRDVKPARQESGRRRRSPSSRSDFLRLFPGDIPVLVHHVRHKDPPRVLFRWRPWYAVRVATRRAARMHAVFLPVLRMNDERVPWNKPAFASPFSYAKMASLLAFQARREAISHSWRYACFIARSNVFLFSV